MVEILGTELSLLTLVISIIIFAAGVLVATIARTFVRRFTTSRFPADVSRLITRAAFWAIIAIAAFSAIGNAGIDFTGVLVAAGILGVVLGFALQPVVVNLISGLFMQLDRTAKVGDPVELVDPEVAGIILDINIFSTRIRTFDGVFVRVPNDRVFTSQIRNFSSTVARRVDMTVTIAYKEDAERARNLIKEMLDNNPHVLTDPAPEVMTWELAENSVNILIWPWVPSPAWLTLRKQMAEDIKKLLDENKIEIPFPQRTVWFGEPKQGEKNLQSVMRTGSESRQTQTDSAAT